MSPGVGTRRRQLARAADTTVHPISWGLQIAPGAQRKSPRPPAGNRKGPGQLSLAIWLHRPRRGQEGLSGASQCTHT